MRQATNPLLVIIVLGGTVSAVLYAYQVSVIAAAGTASRWLARPRVTDVIEFASGIILILLGTLVLGAAVAGLFA